MLLNSLPCVCKGCHAALLSPRAKASNSSPLVLFWSYHSLCERDNGPWLVLTELLQIFARCIISSEAGSGVGGVRVTLSLWFVNKVSRSCLDAMSMIDGCWFTKSFSEFLWQVFRSSLAVGDALIFICLFARLIVSTGIFYYSLNLQRQLEFYSIAYQN